MKFWAYIWPVICAYFGVSLYVIRAAIESGVAANEDYIDTMCALAAELFRDGIA